MLTADVSTCLIQAGREFIETLDGEIRLRYVDMSIHIGKQDRLAAASGLIKIRFKSAISPPFSLSIYLSIYLSLFFVGIDRQCRITGYLEPRFVCTLFRSVANCIAILKARRSVRSLIWRACVGNYRAEVLKADDVRNQPPPSALHRLRLVSDLPPDRPRIYRNVKSRDPLTVSLKPTTNLLSH